MRLKGRRQAYYQNPVYDRPFPDPFVLKFGDTFYGYCTGLSASDSSAFPIIRSHDLVEWTDVGGAMEQLPTRPPHYWAPEVTYSNGLFHLYYSCGNETRMEIRVATSSTPSGGFVDRGLRLTSENFAIDPHVFVDDDGEKYLFYATDFLTHTHVGTGTVVDRLIDWFTLEGKPTPVTRARFDWQVYDPRRAEKGNVRWHTVEGPSVIKSKGKYFQMFSGGNWKNESYGVAYAVSEKLYDGDEWTQTVDGISTLPVLRSSSHILGPGHNSVVKGPNNRERFCVYHSWVEGDRVMSIDRLDIVADRMILLGPTVSPQIRPFASKVLSSTNPISSNFLLEAMLRLTTSRGSLRFATDDGRIDLAINSEGISLGSTTASYTEDLHAYQTVAIDVNCSHLKVLFNGRLLICDSIETALRPVILNVYTEEAELVCAQVTEGFVDEFQDGREVSNSGWSTLDEKGHLSISDGALTISPGDRSPGEPPVIAVKGSCFPDFEFAANIRTLSGESQQPFGFVLLSASDKVEVTFSVVAVGPLLTIEDSNDRTEIELPVQFLSTEYRQFRFVKIGDALRIDLEGYLLAEIKVSSEPSRIGIVSLGAPASIEMLRSVRINF